MCYRWGGGGKIGYKKNRLCFDYLYRYLFHWLSAVFMCVWCECVPSYTKHLSSLAASNNVIKRKRLNQDERNHMK